MIPEGRRPKASFLDDRIFVLADPPVVYYNGHNMSKYRGSMDFSTSMSDRLSIAQGIFRGILFWMWALCQDPAQYAGHRRNAIQGKRMA